MNGVPPGASLWAAGWFLGLILAGTAGTPPPQNEGDFVRYLDARNATLSQTIEDEKPGSAQSKFVEVRVVEVVNPGKIPLTFEVWYRASDEAKTLLGAFSLYPPDNPGRFIVPTQARVKNEGAIQLSLVVPDPAPGREKIRVGVKRLRFVDG